MSKIIDRLKQLLNRIIGESEKDNTVYADKKDNTDGTYIKIDYSEAFGLSEEQKKKIENMDKIFSKYNENLTVMNIASRNNAIEKLVGNLENTGWTLPIELPISAFSTIQSIDNIEAIEFHLKSFFSYDNYSPLELMKKRILDSSISDGLKEMVRECGKAFECKLYIVTANSLVAAIEGLLSEFSDNKSTIDMKKVVQKQVDEFPEDGNKLMKYTWYSYKNFVDNLYSKSDFNSYEPNMVNRHWLLHGRSNYDIKEIDCLRLFNAIDSLCFMINKEKEESNN